MFEVETVQCAGHVIWEHHISFLMQQSLQYSGRELHYCRQIGQETQCPLSIHPLSQQNPPSNACINGTKQVVMQIAEFLKENVFNS